MIWFALCVVGYAVTVPILYVVMWRDDCACTDPWIRSATTAVYWPIIAGMAAIIAPMAYVDERVKERRERSGAAMRSREREADRLTPKIDKFRERGDQCRVDRLTKLQRDLRNPNVKHVSRF